MTAWVALGVGLLLGALALLVFLRRRARWLAGFDFELIMPPVPRAVLARIRAAEAKYYLQQSWLRRGLEGLQDLLAYAAPVLVTRFDCWVGRYRVKPSTVRRLLPWAEEQGYLVVHGSLGRSADVAVAYFSQQPALNDWQAALILEHLRCMHPHLQTLDWTTIAADPLRVAVLYSGYMGAGGDWSAWRASLRPGPEALRRMGVPGDEDD